MHPSRHIPGFVARAKAEEAERQAALEAEARKAARAKRAAARAAAACTGVPAAKSLTTVQTIQNQHLTAKARRRKGPQRKPYRNRA